MARKPKQKIKPTAPRPATMTSYYRALKRIVVRLATRIDLELGPILYNLEPGDGARVQGVTDAVPGLGAEINSVFQSLYAEFAAIDRLAGPLARRALTTANKQQRADFIKSFRAGAGVDIGNILDPSARVGARVKIGEELVKRNLLIDRGINATFEQAVNMNVQLIKTVGPQYLDQVENAIYTGLRTGVDGHSLKQMVMQVNGQNYNRAKLIARDQLQKFNAALSQSRQQAIGVDGYVWRTSGDERVRETHEANNGQRFSWNNPPAETGHPGEDIQCRCTAEPDLSNIMSVVAPVNLNPTNAKPNSRKIVKTAVTANAPKLKSPRVLKREMREKEAVIVKNKYETGVLFDDTGEVFRKKGGKGSVNFKFEELIQMKGRTLTHNHPGYGGTFTSADISLFSEYKLKEIRAVDTVYEYSLKGNANPGAFVEERIRALEKRSRRSIKTWMASQVRKGILTDSEIMKHGNETFLENIHEGSVRIFKEANLEYKRTKRNAKG